MADVFGEGQPPGALTAAELRELLTAEPPLVEGLASLAEQLQPNGLDVRLESIWSLQGAGLLGAGSRELPAHHELPFGPDGWLRVEPGAYVIRLCEIVHLPLDVMALGYSRSSLLRSGCALLNAIWDAGYRGRSEALLVVFNPAGLVVERGARIAQLVFFRLSSATTGYDGAYQGENLPVDG